MYAPPSERPNGWDSGDSTSTNADRARYRAPSSRKVSPRRSGGRRNDYQRPDHDHAAVSFWDNLFATFACKNSCCSSRAAPDVPLIQEHRPRVAADFEEETVDKQVEFSLKRQPMANGQPRKLSPRARGAAVRSESSSLTGCGMCDTLADSLGCCQGGSASSSHDGPLQQPPTAEWRPGSSSDVSTDPFHRPGSSDSTTQLIRPGDAVERRYNTRSPDRSPCSFSGSPNTVYGTPYGTGYPRSLPNGSSAGFHTDTRLDAFEPPPPPPPPRPGFSSPIQQRRPPST